MAFPVSWTQSPSQAGKIGIRFLDYGSRVVPWCISQRSMREVNCKKNGEQANGNGRKKSKFNGLIGAPGEVRTPNPRFRRHAFLFRFCLLISGSYIDLSLEAWDFPWDFFLERARVCKASATSSSVTWA